MQLEFFKRYWGPIFLVLTWGIWALLYVLLRQNPYTQIYSGFLSFSGETALDVLAGIYLFRMWQNSSGLSRSILLLMLLSFFCAIFSDGIYNIIINIFGMVRISNILDSAFDIPFLGFLIFQFLAWAKMAPRLKAIGNKSTSLIVYFPIFIMAILVFFIFFFALQWKIEKISLVGVYQLLDTFFELLGFSVVMMCLAASTSIAILYMALGYLVIIASDFIIRFSVIAQSLTPANILEATWVLGLSFIILGLKTLKREKIYKISEKWLYELNNIKSQCTFWGFALCVLSLGIFFAVNYTFSLGKGFFNEKTVGDLPSILIVFSIFVVVISSLFAKKLVQPFQFLENSINTFIQFDQKFEISSKNYSIVEFAKLEEFLLKAFSIFREKAEIEQSLSQVATQVAHDIRSPLAAISTALHDIKSIPEERRIMIKNAAIRINDIANNLLSQYKTKDYFNFSNEILNPELLFSIIDSIISEKRFEYMGRRVEIFSVIADDSYSSFAKVNLGSFKRVMSNLINNAVEAIDKERGIINIKIYSDFGNVYIVVKDNGCGIPKEIIPNVIEKGFSFGKASGGGFGLFYAKEEINRLCGKLIIDSKLGLGTKVTITLPKANTPQWFCEKIDINPNSRVVILDDDASIHNVWSEKLGKLPGIKITNLFRAPGLITIVENKEDFDLYLVDYDLANDLKNGLDYIEDLGIANKSILVTSFFEDPTIRKRCESLSIKIIPKSFVSHIHILTPVQKEHTFVFIDDDATVRFAWSLAARLTGDEIYIFSSPNDFDKEIDKFSKDINIYIDSELSGNLKGEDYAKILHSKGFRNLYLTSGHPKENFSEMPWIKSIVGKEPPFLF